MMMVIKQMMMILTSGPASEISPSLLVPSCLPTDGWQDPGECWLFNIIIIIILREAITREKCSFFNIVQKAFAPPPPFYLNICPILQGVFFKRVFEH